MNLLIIEYVFSGTFLVFFMYLLFLMVRTVSATKIEAHIVVIIASTFWGISIPSSFILAFLALLGSGAPTTPAWFFLMTEFSLLLLFLLSLYSLSNIWQRYRTENYKSVVRFAAVPYIAVFLVVVLVAGAYYSNENNKRLLAPQSNPSIGFLVPFVIDGFEEKSREYATVFVDVSYTSLNQDGTTSRLDFHESLAQHEAYEVSAKGNIVYKFEYEGRPGVVIAAKAGYFLYWDDDGKLADLSIKNYDVKGKLIDKSTKNIANDDLYYPKKLEGILKSMERVK